MIVRPGDTVVMAFDMHGDAQALIDLASKLEKVFAPLDIGFKAVMGLRQSFIVRSDET